MIKSLCLGYFFYFDQIFESMINFFQANKLEKYLWNCFYLFLLMWNPLEKSH